MNKTPELDRLSSLLSWRKFKKWTEIYKAIQSICMQMIDILEWGDSEEGAQFKHLNNQISELLLGEKFSDLNHRLYSLDVYDFHQESDIHDTIDILNEFTLLLNDRWNLTKGLQILIENLEQELRFILDIRLQKEFSKEWFEKYIHEYIALSKRKNLSDRWLGELTYLSKKIHGILNYALSMGWYSQGDDIILEWFKAKGLCDKSINQIESEPMVWKTKTTRFGRGIQYENFTLDGVKTVDGYYHYLWKTIQCLKIRLFCTPTTKEYLALSWVHRVQHKYISGCEKFWMNQEAILRPTSKYMTEQLWGIDDFWEEKFVVDLFIVSQGDTLLIQDKKGKLEWLIESDFHELETPSIREQIGWYLDDVMQNI